MKHEIIGIILIIGRWPSPLSVSGTVDREFDDVIEKSILPDVTRVKFYRVVMRQPKPIVVCLSVSLLVLVANFRYTCQTVA